MPTGRGKSLGRAVTDLYGQLFGTRVRSSYQATGWHAQLRELTSTRTGREAADKAGLSPTPRTYLAWLAETRTPNKANRERIANAYRMMQGGFKRSDLEKEIQIKGRVTFRGANGRVDSRVRGAHGTAPLRVDGASGNWDPIAEAWDRGDQSPGIHEDLFIEHVIVPDFGETSEGAWGSAFDGDWYEVTI